MKNLKFVESLVRYDAPQIEIIEVEVEKGFAGSGIETEDMNVRDDVSVG